MLVALGFQEISRRHWFLSLLQRTEALPFTLLCRSQIEDACDYSVDRLVSGTAQLLDECTIKESGLLDECNIAALIDIEGGKRKRKKKDYKGRPKKIKHKHKSRSKALLEYYNIEQSGKVKKLKHECTKCEVGKFKPPRRCSDQFKLILTELYWLSFSYITRVSTFKFSAIFICFVV